MDRNRKILMLGSALLGGVLLASAAAPAMAAEPAGGASSSHATVTAAAHDGQVKALAIPVVTGIVNTTSAPVKLDVNGYGMSGHQVVTLGVGQTWAVAGHSFTGHDIEGTMTFGDGIQVPFWVNNPYIGEPTVGFGDGSNWDHYDETQKITKVESGHSFEVVRANDRQMETVPTKQILISITS